MIKLFAAHLPLEAKEHWENDIQGRVWRQLTSLPARDCLHGHPTI